MPKSYSPLKKDLWTLEHASTLSYLDVGTKDPIEANDTYLLDLNGWEGVTVSEWWEFAEAYRQVRTCDYVSEKLTAIDWAGLLAQYFKDSIVGYLNLDVSEQADVILSDILPHRVFNCVTVKHGGQSDYRDSIRGVLKVGGYHPHRIDVEGVDFWLRTN